MAIRTDDQLKDGKYGSTNPMVPNNTITSERHRDIIDSKVSRQSIQDKDTSTIEGQLIQENEDKQAEQDGRLTTIEDTMVKTVNGVTPNNGEITINIPSVEGFVTSVDGNTPDSSGNVETEPKISEDENNSITLGSDGGIYYQESLNGSDGPIKLSASGAAELTIDGDSYNIDVPKAGFLADDTSTVITLNDNTTRPLYKAGRVAYGGVIKLLKSDLDKVFNDDSVIVGQISDPNFYPPNGDIEIMSCIGSVYYTSSGGGDTNVNIGVYIKSNGQILINDSPVGVTETYTYKKLDGSNNNRTASLLSKNSDGSYSIVSNISYIEISLGLWVTA